MIGERIQNLLLQVILGLGLGLLLLGILLAIDSSNSLINIAEIKTLLDSVVGGIILASLLIIGAIIGLMKTRTLNNPDPPEPLVLDSHVEANSSDQVFLGKRFNREYEAVLANGSFVAREQVQNRLRDVAVEKVSTVDQLSRKEARSLVLSGDWTGDPLVAAFVGDETASDPPLKWQIYLWLYEDRAFERSVERTLTEIEQYNQGVVQ